ncbi:hypothetical protein TI05_06340 [Achromatium sp. WMS3]|nr:hypothetical protein TI05_06340 [Achromatium sp. WMS3]
MNKPKVLFIDDEERIVRSLTMQFRTSYKVKGLTDPAEALNLIRNDHYHVVVSDQRMPEMQGTELLKQVREISPLTIGILLTGYADLPAVIGTINDGEIFRYLTKPWNTEEITQVLGKATDIAIQMEQFSTVEGTKPTAATPTGPHIMVMDGDLAVHETIASQFEGKYIVHWAPNLDTVFDLLTTHDIALAITDLMLEEEEITPVLGTLKQHNPNILTIVLTTVKDSKIVINLINQAQVFRYLPKPIRPNLLNKSVSAALERYTQLCDTPILTKRHSVEEGSTQKKVTPKKTSGFLQRLKARFANAKAATT